MAFSGRGMTEKGRIQPPLNISFGDLWWQLGDIHNLGGVDT